MKQSQQINKSALVIGDAIVDSYLTTRPVGISDEAAILVLDWVETTHALGGMLNVARSLRATGLSVRTLALSGDDEPGRFLSDECDRLGIQAHWLSDGRPTTEKMRVAAGPDYLARIDTEIIEPLGKDLLGRAEAMIAEAIPRCDVVVVSDYAKGMLSETLAQKIVSLANQHEVPVIVDAKPATMQWYRGASLFTPNLDEALRFGAAAGLLTTRDDVDVEALGRAMVASLEGSVVLTRAGAGMTLYTKDPSGRAEATGHYVEALVKADQMLATSGAGDVVVAVLAASAALGIAWPDALARAARAAAVTLTRPGTCCLQPGDLELN